MHGDSHLAMHWSCTAWSCYLGQSSHRSFILSVACVQIETAVSKAIFDNEKKLREQGSAQHAPLKNCPRDMMVYGYKILYKPLQDKVRDLVLQSSSQSSHAPCA